MTMTKTAIRIVVEPLINDAMDKAQQHAEARIENLKLKMAELGWNRNAVHYPRSMFMNQREFMVQKTWYNFVHKVTKLDPVHYPKGYNYGLRDKPEYVVINEERVAEYIEAARRDAADQYELFIMKLEHKVGAHTEAILEGNHVWGESFLFVTLPDGEVKCWKTQQIDNHSKLGKWFPQWPSRVVKRKYIPKAA